MEQPTRPSGTTIRTDAVAVHAAELVLERLGRIRRLSRADAEPAQLLAELRLLVDEAEAWSNREGGDAGAEATERLRRALAHDPVEA